MTPDKQKQMATAFDVACKAISKSPDDTYSAYVLRNLRTSLTTEIKALEGKAPADAAPKAP